MTNKIPEQPCHIDSARMF